MGRAPNPGGPQRVSAHVVAKPKPFSEDEERTTIESQWEDEASTTVEQGEVAEKLRALNVDTPAARRQITGITSTGANSLEELTVDEQKVNPAIVALAPPDPIVVRLVITQGNDAGQEIEIQPGKTYTIGRAVDNDIVLTDIAVSRKHFDLRHEDGSWVIVDCGSGNGTVVNGNIEDNPFMLASGDMIEIGNTVFRFDQPEGPGRRASSFDVEVDEEELSTVAGKPLRQEIVDAPPPSAFGRPKTLPPPVPRSQAPLVYPSQGQPASTLPMPQMANRPPMSNPAAPTMLGEAMVPGMMPTTIPGQGPPQLMYNGYPQATDIPPHSVHAQMLVLAQQQGRNDPSTTLVPPTPYGMPLHMQQQQRYVQPQLTKRVKYVLVVSGIAMFAAIATIAVLKSSGKPALAGAAAGSATKSVTPADPSKQIAPSNTIAIVPKVDPVPPPRVDPPKITPIEPAKVDPPKQVAPPKVATIVDPPAPKPEPPKPKVDPPKVATIDRPPPKLVDPPKPDPPKQADPPKLKIDPARFDPKPESSKEAKVAAKAAPKPAKRTTPTPTTSSTPTPSQPKRVATSDLGDVRAKADDLYKQRKFREASNLLAVAAKGVEESEAKGLRFISESYARLGRAYFLGMAPGTKATEAYESLKNAAASDRNVGGAFDSDIEAKLAEIAPKAAIMYIASKDYGNAHLAVLTAETFGPPNATVKTVRQGLESKAAELYGQASSEIDSSPDSAKDKLHQIQKMVDGKSQWYQKATKLLAR